MRLRVWFAYAALYLVWGSTYLAMRVTVQTLPPFLAATTRFAFAGVVLLAWGLRRNDVRITGAHLLAAVTTGLLLLVGGNACVQWAMKTVPSGFGALLLATTPLFMTLLQRERPSARVIAGIVLGLIGVAILVDPFAAHRAVPLAGSMLLLLSSISWAIGSSLPRRLPPHPSTSVASGLQMLCGSVVLAVLSVATGELAAFEPSHVTQTSALSLIYLAVFGSLIGYTSYNFLLAVEPPSRVSTYAYVNPMVAVVLGAVVGGEAVSPRIVVAGAFIVLGVIALLGAKTSSTVPRGEPVDGSG